jgi:hypothetical protein
MECLISVIEYCCIERQLDAELNLRDLARDLGIGIGIEKQYLEDYANTPDRMSSAATRSNQNATTFRSSE